ncbi:TPA: DUF3157 family protein [Photobacterium damselae]|uniref:DUF3157 family protein n=1 Tax=Photobacterium damselae TaxID=38293 RepID=UPI001F3CB094|nr:DUF3157 family protein [Photobacterium damselae]MCG9777768.1 DUF3157 family protein [Photobacterium damselae]UKA08549.1 DUF3157 family protein [Photobacterium damselae subsp. damselae]UKA11870.1 DUF3157 family protein [Photobacterium damselae subsp. damselae]UKA23060.1 DUF3157 family protein [Photobacterium damselae subsp. damselae]
MHLKYRLISAAVLGLLSANVAAQQVVELKDGRRVQLNDDFTWQYVQKQQTTTAKPEVLAASAQLAPVTAVPFTNTVVGTQFKLNSSKPILQLSQSGIDAILQPAYYQGNELIIPVGLTNQGTDSVVLVKMNITLADANGKSLASESVKVWSAIKRMPETYLRAKTQKQGLPIKLKVPSFSNYQIKAEITEVEHW